MKILFTTLVFLFLTQVAYTQPCTPGYITLNTQSQVDSFPISHPNCTELDGLFIGINAAETDSSSDITNLAALSQLNFILGSLQVSNCPLLGDFVGLHNIKEIDALKIYSCDLLKDFTGFDNLERVDLLHIGKVSVTETWDNVVFENFIGLNAITEIGDLTIQGNNIQSFAGLETIQKFNTLSISSNSSLSNFVGLGQVDTIGNLYLGSSQLFWNSGGVNFWSGKHNFKNFVGLSSLKSISNLKVEGSLFLEDFVGLDSLEEVTTSFFVGEVMNAENTGYSYFSNNLNLKGFGGMPRLKRVGNLKVVAHNQITHFAGFEQLEQINGFLFVASNTVESLSGLDGVTYFGKNITLASSGLSDLTALSQLDTVRGSLTIRKSDHLVDMNGLESLKAITGKFDVKTCSLLSNFAGLDSLNYVGNLIIGGYQDAGGPQSTSGYSLGNRQLVSLDGLQSLETIEHDLVIIGNDSLFTLDGLNVTELNGDIYIGQNVYSYDYSSYGNARLADVSALKSIPSVVGSVHFLANDALHSIDFDGGLKQIGGSLIISRNDTLEDLSGMVSLNSVNELEITYNKELVNLDGLDSLTLAQSLTISHNQQLSMCSNHGICTVLGLPNIDATISTNLEGCNTTSEIESQCIVATNFLGIQRLSLYPNPASSTFAIDMSIEKKAAKILIYNNLGLVVLSEKGVNEIDISYLPQGMYRVVVYLNQQVFLAKLVVQ